MAIPLIRSALAIALLALPLVPTPAQGQAASPAPTRAPEVTTLSPALYDPHWKVVVVPYTGPVPRYTTDKLTHPARVYFDFEARFRGRYPAGPVARHASLTRWAMAPRGDGKVRLTLTFRTPTDVKVIHNARRKMLVFVPQAASAAASPAPRATPTPTPPLRPSAAPAAGPMGYTALGTARYDAQRGAIVVPFMGDIPAHTSEALTNPPRVYFDFQGTFARPSAGGPVTGHASLVRWAMAPRDPRTTRLTLTFERPTLVTVSHDAARREVILTPASAATPAPRRTPAPTAAPSLAPPLIPGPESDRRATEPAQPLPEGGPSQPLP